MRNDWLSVLSFGAGTRDWFDWSGWVATILGAGLSLAQLLYAAIRSRRIKRQRRLQAAQAESRQANSTGITGAQVANAGPPLWPPLVRVLLWVLIFQPTLGLAAWIFVLGDLPPTTLDIHPILIRIVRDGINEVGLLLMLILGGIWLWGAWRFYKRLRDGNRGWLIVPIAGAVSTGGFAIIIAVYTKLRLDWISMLWTYRVVNYAELLQKSGSRLQALIVVVFTWNWLSLSYGWLWMASIGWLVIIAKAARKLAEYD